MDHARLRRGEIAFIVGVSIAWAILLLFHPGGEGDQIYAELDGDGTRMLIVHVGMVIFIPLMAAAVYVLLRGLESTAAYVSLIALVFFVVFYLAWEALQGIANGILVDEVSALPEADRGVGAELTQNFAESAFARDFGIFAVLGSVALVVAMVAAGLALRDAGAPGWAPWGLGVAGLLISGHPPPFGPIGLVLFAILVVLLMRSQPTAAPRARESPG
jgi:hypothetical protein